MGRKIVFPECNTIFDEDILKQRSSENTCLVCGASLLGDNKTCNHEKPESPKEKKTYYYGGRSATLTTVFNRKIFKCLFIMHVLMQKLNATTL